MHLYVFEVIIRAFVIKAEPFTYYIGEKTERSSTCRGSNIQVQLEFRGDLPFPDVTSRQG